MLKVIAVFTLTLLNRLTPLVAQPIGSPIGTQAHREFTVSITGGHLRTRIRGIDQESTRYVLKTIWRATQFFDLYAQVGFADLSLKPTRTGLSPLEANFNLLYGAGFNLRVIRLTKPGISLFFHAQAFRFASTPSRESLITVGNQEVTQVLEMHYDWRQGNFGFGLAKRLKALDFYAGAHFRVIQRLETKVEKLLIGGSGSSQTEDSGEYLSGLQKQAFAGVDVHLPSRFKISLEVAGHDKSEFAIYLGISQSGKP